MKSSVFAGDPAPGSGWGHRNHCAAFLAGTQFLVAGEFLVNLPHRIGAVIADFDRGFVNFFAALVAEPAKMINFAGAAFALENNEPGIFLEPRRVRHAGGTKEELAGFYVGCLFFAIGCPIDQMLYAGQLQRHFVSRIDVEIPALFAPAAQECDGLGILPQHAAAFAFSFDIFDDVFEVYRYELFHGMTIAPTKHQGQQRTKERNGGFEDAIIFGRDSSLRQTV
jgi:hypothetical protein